MLLLVVVQRSESPSVVGETQPVVAGKYLDRLHVLDLCLVVEERVVVPVALLLKRSRHVHFLALGQ